LGRELPNIYIIAGCNGAGKTTASFTILPEMLNCKEFVNADGIAAGLSPFNPESVAIEAGRLMLLRIHELVGARVNFAFETTLATRSYVSLVKAAQQVGYKVTLLFIWLDSPEAAIQRVADRVAEGGHNIPEDVIVRRYYRGISNLINLYMPICDSWIVVNNKSVVPELISKGTNNGENIIQNHYIWSAINAQSKKHGDQ
jgi:predicted ABC-type ATPase